MMLKIFEVDEAEWYAAESAEAAQAEYFRTVGEEEAARVREEFGAPIEVPEELWDKKEIVEIDEPGHPTYTFRQALEQRKLEPIAASLRPEIIEKGICAAKPARGFQRSRAGLHRNGAKGGRMNGAGFEKTISELRDRRDAIDKAIEALENIP